ncbi:LysR family transcriptional regulator [Nocardia asteroides]|uniref:LysR family transcriptional regulator n=1 Tax=Nocardia asteroides TaxID=1824 RepID=UPI001E3C75B5|nr:LysR family transcriptional regulator [Nocardia asteroides]UGT63497.1 LysR family transcriptional regulator [Nocardia asteroides]
MELRQIECFLACREHGSFTAAARSLSMVQSAVSASVAKLERELGARLFDRTPRALLLTEAGAAVVEPALEMLRARRAIGDGVAAARGEVRGEVVLGNLLNIHLIDLAGVLAGLHRRYPAVTVRMRQSAAGAAGNLAGLREGSLDLALLVGVSAELPGITRYPLAEESVVLCTAPGHPLAGRPFRPAELDGERFIDFPPGWGTRTVADAVLPLRRPVIEVAEQAFALELAAKGFGVVLVPRSVAAVAPGIRYGERAGAPIPWHLTVGHAAGRTPTNAARTVLTALLNR